MIRFSLALSCLLLPHLAWAQQAPADPALQQALREVRAIRDADAIVVARVVDVHPSPGIWCGTAVTHQDVSYRIERSVAGARPEGEVRVGHLLVSGSPLVCEHAPFLRPERFYVGARALLCLNREDDGGYVVLDESYGARLLDAPRKADPRQTAVLQQLLALPALQPYLHLERTARRPVRVLLNDVVPLPIAVTAGDQPVEFLPPELLQRDAHLVIGALHFEGARAEVKFTLPAEGVIGTARCVQSDGRWVVETHRIVER